VKSEAACSWEVREDMKDFQLIPYHAGTHRFDCEHCHWWCVREQWSLYELSHADADYVVAPIVQRWMVNDWLRPLELIANDLNAEFHPQDLFAGDMDQHLQLLTGALANHWPDNVIELLCCGADSKSRFGCYRVQHLDMSFLMILRQTETMWYSLEVIETVNSICYDHDTAILDVSTVRQITHPTKLKHRLKQGCSDIKIPVERLDALFPSACESQVDDWEKLAELPSLYAHTDPVSMTLLLAFD